MAHSLTMSVIPVVVLAMAMGSAGAPVEGIVHDGLAGITSQLLAGSKVAGLGGTSQTALSTAASRNGAADWGRRKMMATATEALPGAATDSLPIEKEGPTPLTRRRELLSGEAGDAGARDVLFKKDPTVIFKRHAATDRMSPMDHTRHLSQCHPPCCKIGMYGCCFYTCDFWSKG